jgi:hypothetical protein
MASSDKMFVNDELGWIWYKRWRSGDYAFLCSGSGSLQTPQSGHQTEVLILDLSNTNRNADHHNVIIGDVLY